MNNYFLFALPPFPKKKPLQRNLVCVDSMFASTFSNSDGKNNPLFAFPRILTLFRSATWAKPGEFDLPLRGGTIDLEKQKGGHMPKGFRGIWVLWCDV